MLLSYVCRISHRYLQCFGHLSTFCTCQLRLALVFETLCGGFGGDGRGAGGDDVHATCDWCFDVLVLTFFCYVIILRGVAFRIGICSVLAISRLSAHASFDLHLFLNSVRGFGGDGRGGGDDVHATATGVLMFLC